MSAFMTAIAFLLERLFGYPAPVQRIIGHPVEWIGGLIGLLDTSLNRADSPPGERRLFGALTLAIVVSVTGIVAASIQAFCQALPFGFVLEALIASAFLASRHLGRAVHAVADGLQESLGRGQVALQPIVGRDARSLDDHGVARAAIETLAENTSDGIIAPLIFLMLFGLPGIAVYKAVNTADSMLGHMTARHREFGWASARLDDIVNFLPARVTALLIASAAQLTGADSVASWRAAMRDGPQQDSPNSGWPEAAMAGALGLKLGGPRAYGGAMTDLPFMGTGRAEAVPDDIGRALKLYGRANDVALVAAVILAWLLVSLGVY